MRIIPNGNTNVTTRIPATKKNLLRTIISAMTNNVTPTATQAPRVPLKSKAISDITKHTPAAKRYKLFFKKNAKKAATGTITANKLA